MSRKKQMVSTGTIWEEVASFSRALRIDNRILISGTTATSIDGIIGKGDPRNKRILY